MIRNRTTRPIQRLLDGTAVGLVAALSFAPAAVAETTAPSGPDVTVFSFTDYGNYGSSGGFVGYSIGTRSCNRGDTPLNWCDTTNNGCAAGATTADHPVIAQNLYRLKNGRFEQVGMSWLKHGFVSTNSTTAGCTGSSGQSCVSPPEGGDQLGVGCTDPYVSSLNGSRPMGRRSEVDATTGEFPMPPSSPGGPYAVYDQRLKVAVADVDPAQNAGALYFAEAQYIAPDDADAGNGLNNASYRQVAVGAGPSYALSSSGTFVERSPAILVWPVQDPGVELLAVDVPGSDPVERFHVARKVTTPVPGTWHYEYAVHNLNSDRSARLFSIDFADGATFSNPGFRSIDHHSGEPYTTEAWTSAVDDPNSVLSWSTSAYSAGTENANALRWATMFNFWFDSDHPPGDALHTLGFFKPGTPVDTAFVFALFNDGFEAGSTVAWSSEEP